MLIPVFLIAFLLLLWVCVGGQLVGMARQGDFDEWGDE